MTERDRLSKTARSILIPALSRAAENYYARRRYIVTDLVGYKLTEMEALLRPLWGIAPLLEENAAVPVLGEDLPADELIRKIMLDGTGEDGPLSFSEYAASDPVGFSNQATTELAAYAVALYFAKDRLWDPYSPVEKEQVGGWLKKWALFGLRHSWDNNHFWFPLLVITALERVGIDAGDVGEDFARAFRTLDAMYISDGWYQDGKFGRFDYYLAWSHHVYPLIWSKMAEGTRFYDAERAERYVKRTEEFIPFYLSFFDSDGSVPPMGRSLSYRFAESAVFPVAAFAGCAVPYGTCRRAMMKNVAYFTDNMIGPDGVLTPGYLYPSTPVNDSYTSQLGSLWCAKTFLALALPEDHPFWKDPEEPLPSEKSGYVVKAAPSNINVVISSEKSDGVTLYNNTASYYQEDFGHTFNDMASCYCKFAYNSRSGFGFSIPDKGSCDNMISLLSPDFTMFSHRRAYEDLGSSGDVLTSRHVPFPNDPETVIKTWIVVLSGSLHVRAHRVILSRPYRVREGGYSIGVFDDSASFSNGTLKYKDRFSRMKTVASVPFDYRCLCHSPERHLLAPQSKYPSYEVGVLGPGTYFFASAFSYSDREDAVLPELCLDGHVLTVEHNGTRREVMLE